MATEVIMPALGMAQETGLILAWRKKPGDPVKTGDVLMEVETDKAAMEVEAQADGFLNDVRAGEGEEVPVGDVIAMITETADALAAAPPEKAQADAPKAEPKPEPEPEPAKPAGTPAPAGAEASGSAANGTAKGAARAEAKSEGGKILASPKARRLAEEQGLDLNRLARSGHPQPYHVSDLETLSALPGAGASGAARLAVRGRVPAESFDTFAAWSEGQVETDTGAILASFAAGSYRRAVGAGKVSVAVVTPRKPGKVYTDPDFAGLAGLSPDEGNEAVDLVVYDLTATRLIEADLAASAAPALTVARDGNTLIVTLAASPGALDDDALIQLMDAFSGRLEEPLRHLI